VLWVEGDAAGFLSGGVEANVSIDDFFEVGAKVVFGSVECFVVEDQADFAMFLFFEL
jgi:hypothetical protein